MANDIFREFEARKMLFEGVGYCETMDRMVACRAALLAGRPGGTGG